MATATRWGILSCGAISSDFVNAIQHEGSSKHVVTAVAARSLESAEAFAKKFGVKKFYDRYEALAEDAEIDVVYIGVITGMHFDTAKSILAAGKPVLCEKPLCANLAQTQELISFAQKQKLFLMEALWSRYLPVYRELKTRLHNSEVGEVTHAFATFGFPIPQISRYDNQKPYGGGSILALGIYPVQFILFAFGDERPIEVKATGNLNEEGVDVDVTCLLRFSKGRFGTFTISTSGRLPNEAHIYGTKGSFKLDCPFWTPTRLEAPRGEFNAPLDPSDRVYNLPNSQNLKYEANEVANCLRGGELESGIHPHSKSLLLAELMETIRGKLGLGY